MKVKILGTSCYNCVKLETLLDERVKELGVTNVEIVRPSDDRQIRKYMPLDEIPGLLIESVLASTSELPLRETHIDWLPVVPVSGE